MIERKIVGTTIKLFDSLSRREIEIVSCLYFGCTSKEIAAFLSAPSKEISPRTIDKHVENILYKLGFYHRNTLIKYMRQDLALCETNKLEEVYSKLSNTLKQKPICSEQSSLKLTTKQNADNSILAFIKWRLPYRNILIPTLVMCLFSILYLAFQEEDSLVKSTEIVTNKHLVVRKKLLQQVDEVFEKKDKNIKIVSLVGCGGAGKTTLARSYLRKSKNKIAYEINAETEISIRNSFVNLAYKLAKTEADKEDLKFINGISDEKEKHKQFLYFVQKKLKGISDWLLVLDNLENLDYLMIICPYSSEIWGRGNVIITTRNENIKNISYLGDMSVIKIGELEQEEKADLLRKILCKKYDHSQEENFLKQIPSYPLDISSAAYYIKNAGVDFGVYLERTKNITKEFINANRRIIYESTAYNKTRYGIVSSSFSEIVRKNKAFKDLLLLICVFDSQEIPLEILRKLSAYDAVDNFIFYMRQYSLITCDAEKISIHRSTQNMGLNYILSELSLEEKEAFIKRIIGILTPYENLDTNFKDCGKLIPHFKALIKNLDNFCLGVKNKSKAEIALLVTIGNLYKSKEHSTLDSVAYFDKALLINKNAKYLNKAEVFRIFLAAGEACVIGSQNDKAMDYLNKSFASENYDKKHLKDFVENYNLIGIVHMRKNNLGEANKYFDLAIEILKDAPDSAEVRLVKAVSCANKGFTCYLYNINKPQMNDAARMLHDAICIVEKNLPSSANQLIGLKGELLTRRSIQTLINIKCRLGGIYNSLKEYRKALDLENEAEELLKLCSEEDNNTFCNIGLINLEKGHANLRLNNLEAARKYFAKAKNIFDKAQIGDQWMRLRMQETEVLVRLNKLEAAYKNCEDVFALKTRDKNDYNDLFFNTCHYNAGVIKYKQKDLQKSLKHFRDFAVGMKSFCKRFLAKDKYNDLEKEGAFDVISSEIEIARCFENGLKIFSIVCMKGSEFISDYVKKNYQDVKLSLLSRTSDIYDKKIFIVNEHYYSDATKF